MLRVQTIARLGQDAVVNTVNGKAVINFSAAYTEKYRNSDNAEVNNTIWISCAYWSDKTNIANYLKRGVQVFLEGKPESKLYTNKQGQTVPQLHLRVSNIKLLSSGQQNQSATQQDNNYTDSSNQEVSDMPF